jgi:nitrite reductase/ring-hydroxylating ferredoxin subunit
MHKPNAVFANIWDAPCARDVLPMEVLDALLMAFPTLGLARIIWAVDIILDMNIPEFHPDALTRPGEWHDVMASADVRDGEVTRTECDGHGLFVYRDKKSFQVFDSRCPHQSTDIPELALHGSTLTCPKHQWEFDATSGACIKKGNSPLKRFESKVAKGRLLAFW